MVVLNHGLHGLKHLLNVKYGPFHLDRLDPKRFPLTSRSAERSFVAVLVDLTVAIAVRLIDHLLELLVIVAKTLKLQIGKGLQTINNK